MRVGLLTLLVAVALAASAWASPDMSGVGEATAAYEGFDLPRGSTVLFFDDMESGENGWTHVDLTDSDRFHVDEYMAYAGSYSWWCGNFEYDADGGYGNFWDAWLELPSVDISGCTTPVLTFAYRYDTEPAYDFVYVEVYTGGAWIALNAPGWDGSSSGWQPVGTAVFDLTAYKPTVDLRFHFTSDVGYSDADGLYDSNGGACMFDDITVYDYADGTPTPFYDDCETGGLCTPGSIAAAGDYWHIAERRCPAYSDPYVWWCGDDADTTTVPPNLENALVSPPIATGGATSGHLFYRMNVALPDWYAGHARFQVSNDGGVSWEGVGGIRSFYGDFGTCDGWSTWGIRGFDLAPYLPASELQFRLVMETGASGNPTGGGGGSGVFFDDFMVVSTDGGSPDVWQVPGDFATIQEAVNRAVSGDIIEVGDGVYNENVYIGKPNLTLRAGSNPIIDLGKTSPLDPPVGNCITIGAYAYGTTIDGFTLRHGDNGIRNLYYGPPSDVYPDGIVIKNCTIYENYGDASANMVHGDGIILDQSDDSQLLNNHIYGNSELGIFARGERLLIDGNHIHDNGGTAESYRSLGLYLLHSTDCVISGNTISGHGAHGVEDAGGIREYGDTGVEGIDCGNNTYTDNIIYDNEYSIHIQGIYDWPHAANYNSLYSNTAGMANLDWALMVADGINNWWGDPSGPSGSGPGAGDPVGTDITYTPWQTGPIHGIVCTPQTEYLSIGDPTCTIDIDYLGGGTGLMYGYSLVLTWNGAYVSSGEGSVTEGTLLSDLGSTFFNARDTGTNEITIDGMLLGDEPGVSGPGTMFSVEFTAVSPVPYGVSPVNITIDRIRDKDNNDLTGFVDDDGEIIVDSVAPVVTNVQITNSTLTHTNDYIKNGDAAAVSADVSDAHPDFDISDIYADLTDLGGGAMVTPDLYAVGVAVWTLSSVTCTPPDAAVTVTVTAQDDAGNSASDDDDIIADNTAPAPVTNFYAWPGHGECDLSWDDASGNDAYFDGHLVMRIDVPGDYAQYGWFILADDAGGNAGYPADETDGVPVYDGTGTSHTDAVAPRNIYSYQAFCYDIARNYSSVAESARDRATNYWLGDVAEEWGVWGYDGVVDDDDVLKLSDSYWAVDPIGFPGDSECDVGPTVHPDWHRLGLPKPDDQVEFEDAMIFAMNYGVVTAKVVPFLPEQCDPSPLALALGSSEQRGDDVVVALRLEGNSSEVKGMSASLTYDSNELEFVSASLSDNMVSPLGNVFFMHRDEGGRIDLDVVVLGEDVTIGGSGDVAVLTFRALSESYTLEVDDARVRDAGNGELVAKLGDFSSGEELPLRFRLVGNTPNPFNPITKIAYHVPHESEVSIRVYDVAGRIVTTLVDGVSDPGRHVAVWNGTNDHGDAVGSGIYFCSMEAPDFHESRKMTLLK
jgi:hypothetical protein